MPAQDIPKISAAPTNYKKKKTRSSPYKFNKPKSPGKIIKPKPSATQSTRKSTPPRPRMRIRAPLSGYNLRRDPKKTTKSSYGKKKEKKEKKEKAPKTRKGTIKKKTSEKKVAYYEPPKIRFVRIVSTRSMVPMVGCG
mgnify:CR=1 FL=1